MKNLVKTTLLSACLTALLLPAAAQDNTQTPPASSVQTPPPSSVQGSPSSTAHDPNEPSTGKKIQQRKYWQQDRIKNGVNNGELTAGEASSLEKKEANINKEEQQMKAADGGKLTEADREKLQHQQNYLSHDIYQDKHNSASQNTDPVGKPGKRAENQQDRIGNGLKSGQLTAGEASNLESRENAINKEATADRAANGGHLTQAEKNQINHQQNQVSKQIHKDKHNSSHRH